MNYTNRMTSSSMVLGLCIWTVMPGSALAASLTTNEINQIESQLGITLSASEIQELGDIVKPDMPHPQWRIDADARIELNRKANLNIQVLDVNGFPIEDAEVSVKMRSSHYKFGGVLNLPDFSDDDGQLRISTDRYKSLFLKLYNCTGLTNGLKPQHRSWNEANIPAYLQWAKDNQLPARGHLLLWPGFKSFNLPDHIRLDCEALETALTNGTSQVTIDELKVTLKTDVDELVADWSSLWDVYEWDVINEPVDNHRLQDLLGEEEMANWFRIAQSNMVHPGCKLLVNQFQIVSAVSLDVNRYHYLQRVGEYKRIIDQILADGGPLHRIGFQARVRYEHPDPVVVYERLEDFASTYGLEMVATEFEIRDNSGTWMPHFFTEFDRAQITEEMLTTYYSHPLTTGFSNWTYMRDEPYAMCDFDGNVKLNGLAWYYLHRVRYTTDERLMSDALGQATVRAFKGDYNVTVNYQGKELTSTVSVTNDHTMVLRLIDLSETVDHWGYEGLTNGDNLADATSVGTVGGLSFGSDPLATITNGSVRWQSDGVADSLYQNRVPSSHAGATSGTYELSVEYSNIDFTSTAALANGVGRIGLGLRSGASAPFSQGFFRLSFDSGGGSNPTYWLDVLDDTGNNNRIGTFSGTTLDSLKVRAVYDLDKRGQDGSLKVYYQLNANDEVAAYMNGRLASDFLIGIFRLAVQTYDGGANWAAGDHIYMDNLSLTLHHAAASPAFYIQNWMAAFPLGNSTNLQDNSDGDQGNNLLEYAFGGDPANELNTGYWPEVRPAETGGTNYLEYIYAKRVDAVGRGLNYCAETTTNLLTGTWTNANIETVGSGPIDYNFEAITNRIPMNHSNEFIRISVDYAP